MTAKVLILGDGTGGLITANMLARKARKDGLDIEIKVIGRSPTHTYQPGLLFIPFQKSGYRRLSDIQRRTAKYIGRGVDYLCEEIEALDPERRSVTTNVTTHHYDWLVLSLGSRTVIDDIPGLAEHWGDKAHGFYTPDSALKLAKKLDEFKGGDLVIDVAEMPIKCPVAPLEFAGLVDSYLIKRGLREKTKLTLVTPLSGAFTKPVCNDVLTELLEQKGINVVPNLSLGAVNDDHIESPDGHQVPYDLLVTIPPHEGSDIIEDAGLGDGLGFGLTNKHTLKSMKAERIFLIGDNTNVPTSKAGSVAHFQAEVVVHNLFQEIAGKAADPIADGHTNCFIETGHGKATLIDFNYDIQPVPGKFPIPYIGPMTLLHESYLNHLGKLAFKYIYWYMLLPGYPIPLVSSRMSTAGKQMSILEKYQHG
jgi:sulfide:quinone oxidoreductase